MPCGRTERTENPRVGGSIPPLGTIKFPNEIKGKFGTKLDFWCPKNAAKLLR